MATSTLLKTLLASAVIMTGASFSVPDAKAAERKLQLHEMLFGGRNREKREPEVQQVAPKPAVKIQRISGPRYYNYKAPAITSVTLASLVSDVTPATTSSELGLPSMDFDAQRFAEAIKFAPDTIVSIEPEIADAVKKFYAENPRFIWSRGTSVTAQAKAIVGILNAAGDHGLRAEQYAISVPNDNFSFDEQAKRASELLAFELQLSTHVIRYAMDMKDGVINPNKLSGYHDFSGERLTALAAMRNVANPDKGGAAYLQKIVPQQPQYAQLANALKELHKSEEAEIIFPDRVLIKPGAVDETLPLVMKAIERKISDETREKYASVLGSYAGTSLYDGALVDLVRDVQRELKLNPDGVVGPATIARLDSGSIASKIERVELAMERLRWHPEEYGARQVVINQPEYRVRYIENNETKLAMRVVVGSPSNQTYFFTDEIETVVYNPYWGVPQSIIVNEMLPKLRANPSYLDNAGYEVSTVGGKRISSSSVNWSQYGGKVPFNVRQKPGASNALGELKILFPNSHAIYMHDTPSKSFFQRDTRALSHGCVRLQDPRAMAAAVLGKSVDHVATQINSSNQERGERLETKVPIYIAYFTAWPNDDGVVHYFGDVYKRDAHLGDALTTVNAARNEAS